MPLQLQYDGEKQGSFWRATVLSQIGKRISSSNRVKLLNSTVKWKSKQARWKGNEEGGKGKPSTFCHISFVWAAGALSMPAKAIRTVLQVRPYLFDSTLGQGSIKPTIVCGGRGEGVVKTDLQTFAPSF